MNGTDISYTVIRSDRKTLAIMIKNGDVIVRAPGFVSKYDIEQFVAKHRDWIEKQLAVIKAREKTIGQFPRLTYEEIEELAERAMRVIPERVAYYAKLIGVTYGNITIRNQRTRWGSCSSKGNLNFNCLLMLAPLEVLDSVIVHELCHRKEMNHSARFYAEILRVMPDYHKHHAWLTENGPTLLARMVR